MTKEKKEWWCGYCGLLTSGLFRDRNKCEQCLEPKNTKRRTEVHKHLIGEQINND